jgi:hypothetical protein
VSGFEGPTDEQLRKIAGQFGPRPLTIDDAPGQPRAGLREGISVLALDSYEKSDIT